MRSIHRTIAVAFVAASLLASGCYCPMLSGRYSDVGCFPPCGPPVEARPAPAQASNPSAAACPANARGGCCLGKLCGGLWPFGGAHPTPSRQHDDYVSPQPQFHPVPTHPVFSSQPAYPPPFSLDVPPRRHGH